MAGTVAYDANPAYPPVDGEIAKGWQEAIAGLPSESFTLAIDGPMIVDWESVIEGATQALAAAGRDVLTFDLREEVAPWEKIVSLTESPALPEDPHFATLAHQDIADLFERLPDIPGPPDLPARASGQCVAVVYGPGASLAPYDVLWYADLPKRYAEAAVTGAAATEDLVTSGLARNLGQPAGGKATTKRLFYIDWPILDRHREAIAADVDRWLDTREPRTPSSIAGADLRRTGKKLAGKPFRTRPTFNTTSWGGHWAQEELDFNREARNTALGYELIAPESGVLIGEDPDRQVEVPFQLLVGLFPDDILGEPVHAEFGTSFPIRFDYLDTVGGGSLSVHAHPQSDYMQRVFGWPYTQHETYYILVGDEQNKVYLGLREGVDVEEFHRQAHEAEHHGVAFDIEQFVQVHPAEQHQLFLIPAGTPHGSGKGNVVLEVSATPYLYSLRFYDWLRRDAEDKQRATHVEHAFANLNKSRQGAAVREQLVQKPTALRTEDGWQEELLGSAPDMFFDVRRVVIEPGISASDDTSGRFHVLNVVEGDGVEIETAGGDRHLLAYAETMVVPAAVGAYRLRVLGPGRARVVKSMVKES